MEFLEQYAKNGSCLLALVGVGLCRSVVNSGRRL